MRTQILKSLLTLFIVSTFFYSHAQEQGTKELTLGYGTVTTNEILDVILNDFLLSGLTGGLYKTKNHTYSGASYVNFSYAIKNNFLIGAEVVYQRISKDIYLVNDKDGRQVDNSFTIGANAKYSYISNPKFRMYSGLAAGYNTIQANFDPEKGSTSKATKGNKGAFGYHLTAFGFRYGKKAAVIAELGFGYKGILNVGFNYKF
ncbi:hypothetical protein N9O58_03435 [Flavobacteriaceae bacterium]|nr:hypothetical protein [Flavobacteriaceae bacterium]